MSAAPRFIAVIDIGKTNAKTVLHDLSEHRDLAVRSVPNPVRTDGPYQHHDADALFDFVVDSLAAFAVEHAIDAISIAAHGACAVLVGENELVLPILDYEHPLEGSEDYDRIRPPFAETLSPAMANGLNVGRQLFWLQKRFPAEFARARHILPYPQYWAWRLTGIAVYEPTGLGCHTDLWAPREGALSSLVPHIGWSALFPPRRSAFDVLGPLKPELATRIGIQGRAVPVTCGIHDSNASLLPHLLAMPEPFTVLSTGTWVVSFAIGGRPVTLDAARNTLAYVDVFGRPVPSALFMGGREFDMLTDHAPETPDEATVARVIEGGLMVLPPLVPATGPFPTATGGWSDPSETLTPMVRTAAASLYVALTACECLDLIGARGPIVVEGSLARNQLVLRALAHLTGRPVHAPTHGTGTSVGAALLALGTPNRAPATAAPMGEAALPPVPGLDNYAKAWRARVAGHGAGTP